MCFIFFLTRPFSSFSFTCFFFLWCYYCCRRRHHFFSLFFSPLLLSHPSVYSAIGYAQRQAGIWCVICVCGQSSSFPMKSRPHATAFYLLLLLFWWGIRLHKFLPEETSKRYIFIIYKNKSRISSICVLRIYLLCVRLCSVRALFHHRTLQSRIDGPVQRFDRNRYAGFQDSFAWYKYHNIELYNGQWIANYFRFLLVGVTVDLNLTLTDIDFATITSPVYAATHNG